MGDGAMVPGPDRRQELADLLEELKQRSGRSYSALAHRSGLSRSSVHRYCQGSTVPPAFGAVELIARACGVTPGDPRLDRLYRAWQRANASAAGGAEPDAGTDPDTGAGTGTGADPDTGRVGVADVDTDPGTDPGTDPDEGGAEAVEAAVGERSGGEAESAPVRPLRAYVLLRAATLVLALLLTTVASTFAHYRDDGGVEPPSAGADEVPRGPVWSAEGKPVPPGFFGVNVGNGAGKMPGFRFGSVRLWQSESRWGTLEPRRGVYKWGSVDRMVAAAEKRKLPVLFTVSGTPLWATDDPRRSDFRDTAAAPPDDLDDWDRFVRKLAERYEGRIEAYELWDYPNHPPAYSGSMETLGAMVRRASRIIKKADRDAKVLCPSFGGLWTERGVRLLREFALTGAYDYCDAAALKLPPRRADGPPEETIELTKRARTVLYKANAGRGPFWNTGPDRDVAYRPHMDPDRARDYAVRFYLAALYSWHWGLHRTYYYSWGSTDVPLVLERPEGPPTEAARRVERLQRWLDGADMGSCGKGAAMDLVGDAYTCRFTRGATDLRIYWTKKGRGEARVPEGARRIVHMDGRTESADPGGLLVFDGEPVLVESR